VAWSEHLRQRFAGTPVKNVGAALMTPDSSVIRQEGEFLVTGTASKAILSMRCPHRCATASKPAASATLHVDLVPGRDLLRLTQDLAQPRGRDSLSNHLRRRAGISGVKAALLHEYATPADLADRQGSPP
jgi:predicted flavoprotein YhiN